MKFILFCSNTKSINIYFQDHIFEASTAPPIELTAIRNEHNPRVQSGKRLPLKMIISEMASRETDIVETEPAHRSVHSHLDNATLHAAPITKRCPGRYFSFLDYVRNSIHGWNSLNISVPTGIIPCLLCYYG